MNRVYKVIWSKAKHCYVVTSEIARSVTKSASSARSAGRKGAAVLAMAALLFTAGGVLGEAADQANLKIDEHGVVTMVKDDSNQDVNKLVLKVDGDNQITMDKDGIQVGKNNIVIGSDGTIKGANERFSVGPDGKVTAAYGKIGTVEITSAGAVSGVTDLTVSGDVEAVGNLTVGNGNFTVNGITGNVTTGNATIGDALIVKGDTEMKGDLGVKGNLFAGGYTETDAKAALNADGSIKGAEGKFTVGTDGKVTAASGKIGTVDITSDGALTGMKSLGVENINAGGTITGNKLTDGVASLQAGNLNTTGNINAHDINAHDIVATGDISGKAITGTTITGTSLNTQNGAIIGGAITGTTITATGKISTGGDVVSTGGKVQGTSVSDGTATLSGGSLKNAVDINASGTITGNNVVVNNKLTTEALEVKGGLETDHMTLGSEPLNYTKIDMGNVTSKVLAPDGGVYYGAESIFNKDGSSITVRTNEGSVDSTGNSTVGGKEIIQYLGNNAVPDVKNVTRRMVRNDDGTFSMVDTAVDGKDKYSIVSQNAGERKVTVVEGTKNLNVTENLTNGIVSETNGGAGKTVTLTQGMDGTYTVVTSGNSTEEISGKKIENYNGGLATEITGDETHDVSGTMTTTVEGKATENFNGGLATEITGDETHTATGIITNTAQTVKTITENNTVTSDKGGTTFKNEDAKTPFEEGDERGTKDNTKITGNKVETGKVFTDFAEVANNLDVKGSTTLGRDGNTTLTVNSESTFRDTVKMDKTLEVDGESTFNNKVTITKNGLDVTGGTTTDTLTVTGTSEFADRADFRKDVYMWGNLEVTGETRTDTLYVDHDGYVGGNLNVDGNIETHDAVLSADSRQVVTGRQLYQTNERVDRLDNRIKKVGANAAALAALRPGDFNPDDKFSIAAGFGSYRNANAAALGLFYRPNENVLLSLGTSFGDGENMVNAGVSVKFGRGKSMAERRKEMADEVSSMRDEMRSQDERIAELEEMLKKQSELIEKLSKES